jgi:hypothetical protein
MAEPEAVETVTPPPIPGEETISEPKALPTVERMHNTVEHLEKKAAKVQAEADRLRAFLIALEKAPDVIPAFEAWAQDIFR